MENQEVTRTRSPIDYLKIFFRRKWFLITPVFACFVLGIAAAYLLPPTYESSTIILVEEEKIINPLIQNLAVSTTAAQRMQSIREILLGWNSLVELAKKLDLAKDARTQLQYENLILELRSKIMVRMRQPNIIQISYLGKEPRETQLIAQTLTDILVEKNLASQTKETDVAINFITEQLAIYKRKIKESEIAKLNDQLKVYLQDSTEKHPLVKELREKIAIANRELDSGEYEIPNMEMPVNQAAREALKQELDKLIDGQAQASTSGKAFASEPEHDPNSSIYKLLLMDKVGETLAQDIDVNQNIYQMLLQRLETAKITQRLEASKEGTRYTVLDPARLPLRPVRPNKAKVILLGLVMGAFSGTGLVFGREFLEHSFLDIEDAKQGLELPVLGGISRITTQEEIDKEKNKKKSAVAISLLFGALIIILSMVISFLKH